MKNSNANVGTTREVFDYTRLTQRILSEFGLARFARLISVSEKRLERLLRDGGEFSQSEILRAAAVLRLDSRELNALFFAKRVQKLQTK